MYRDKKEILLSVERGALGIEEAMVLLLRLKEEGDPASAEGRVVEAATGGRLEHICHELHWELAEPPAVPLSASDRRRRVLVLGEPSERRKAISGGLRDAEVITVAWGDAFRQRGGTSYEVDPTSEESATRLVQSLVTEGLLPSHVVHLGEGGGALEVPLDDAREERAARELEAVFLLIKALFVVAPRHEVTFLSLQRGGVQASAWPAAFSGLLGVAALENPMLRPKVVLFERDLPVRRELEVALAELGSPSPGELEVKYEGQDRWVRTMRELDLGARGRALDEGIQPLREKGVYLITGGAGGLGMLFAERLAAAARARVVLVGRSRLSEAQERAVEGLRRFGGEAVYCQADVTVREDVERAVELARARFGGLNGVIHAAGVVSPAFIIKKSLTSFKRVLAPKTLGTLHLDHATRAERLDFFALFSSIGATVLSNAGQGDYASANHFMDWFAEDRSARVNVGLRSGHTVSIHWPLWRDGGMGVSKGEEEVLMERHGLAALTADEGFDRFLRALRAGRPQLFLVYGDRRRIEPLIEHRRSGGRRQGEAQAWGAAAPQAAVPQAAAPQAAPLGASALEAHAEAYLLVVISRETKLPKHRIDVTKGLDTIGIDSLLILRLNLVFESAFGPLSKTLLYEYQTVRDLARYFVQNHPEALARVVGATPAETAARPEASAALKPPPAPPVTAAGGPAPTRAAAAPGRRPAESEDDIAIIGLSGRYPEAPDLERLWENLAAGRHSISRIPKERWEYQRYPGLDPDVIEGRLAQWGGFLDDIDRFDPLFFNIAPREVESMDPQERLFLEAAWSALEDAGYSREELHRTSRAGDENAVGVMAGVTFGQYQMLGAEEWAKGNYITPNSSFWSIANRVSYVLDLHGPSMPVDTACSSSLTAVHMACESLRRGDCRVAIAGGVNLNVHASKYVAVQRLKFLSSDGQCRAFGEGGDGYVPGEGVGVVVLKPLRQAEADGDHIYAVIKGSRINHGGKTNGYTVPNPNAQAKLIARALEQSGVDARAVSYVEAHGTGTSLGDPIEISGLTKAFRAHTSDRQFCAIGSIKSNIGHLEPAAGIASLTKVLLQLKHRKLVPSLHAEELNKNIDFPSTPFFVQRELRDWPRPALGRGGEAPRIAAVSSFGAGGSNAHVIVAEYEPPPPTAAAEAAPRGPELIVLSARSAERLRVYAARLRLGLQRLVVTEERPPALRDIAYTLQVGREPLESRLAVIVGSIEELLAELRAFEEGRSTEDRILTGRLTMDGSPPGQPVDAEEVLALLRGQHWSEVARLWIVGSPIPWAAGYEGQGRRRVSLPTYPFERKRFWVSTVSRPIAEAAPHAGAASMIDGPVSSPQGVAFVKTLRRGEALVRDHLVQGQRVVVGVAQVEMARAAGEASEGRPPTGVRDIVWLSPIVVEGEEKEIRVVLEDQGGQLAFEVQSDGPEGRMVHSKGWLVFTPAGDVPPARVDLQAFQRSYDRRLGREEIYAAYRRDGLDYGPTFQCVEALWTRGREALAELRPPADLGGYTLHLALLDGALHAVHGLTAAGGDLRGAHPMVPFSIGEVQIRGRLPARCFAYAELSKARPGQGTASFHVTLLDEEGRVVVAFRDFWVRRFKPAPGGAAISPAGAEVEGDFNYRTCWKDQPLPARVAAQGQADGVALILTHRRDFGLGERIAALHAGRERGTVVVHFEDRYSQKGPGRFTIDPRDPAGYERLLAEVGEVASIDFLGGVEEGSYGAHDLKALERAEEQGVLSLFRLSKALYALPQCRAHLRVVTSGAQEVRGEGPTHPFAAALIGFTKVLSREFRGLRVSCVDVSARDLRDPALGREIARALFEERGGAPGEEIAWRRGRRLVRVLEPVVLPEEGRGALPLRRGGVYLLVGGAGGLGLTVAEHLARRFGARLGLVGRSALDGERARRVQAIEAAGGEVLYVQADLGDPDQMEAAVARVRERFGPIQGVIHSAIVLKDSTIGRMSEQVLRDVLAPKARGAVLLDRAVQGEPLDFFAFFSSAISFTAAPGQANYAAASTFEDSFALFLRSQMGRPVTIFNWGFWGDTGIVATEAYRERLGKVGVESLSQREGLRAFERVMASRAPQVFPVKLRPELLDQLGVDRSKAQRRLPEAVPSVAEPVTEEIAAFVARSREVPGREVLEPLEEVSRLLLVRALQGAGALSVPGERYHRDELRDRLRVLPSYEKLYDALLDILQQGDFVELDGDLVVASRKAGALEARRLGEALRARREALLARSPDAASFLDLLDASVPALPDVLAGRISPTDVLFPGGSKALVEKVYKGSRRTDHFNDIVRVAVCACVERLRRARPGDRIAILEIGAGTGGTSASVLEALAGHGDHLSYAYTDISPSFTAYGQRTYGARYPFAQFKVLDIEKDLGAQGVDVGAFDFVLATNVLHATRDIRRTVRSAKALLRANGLLLINEVTEVRDFATLTFGLTPGWWLFEDDLRLPHSPMLSLSGWRGALEDAGFRAVTGFGLPHGEVESAGQHVILCESDGWVEEPRRAAPAAQATARAAAAPKRPEPRASAAVPQAEAADLAEALREHLKGVFAATLKIDPAELEAGVTFERYGVDSLVAMDIVERLQVDFGPLPKTLLFEHITLDKLARYFLQAHAERARSKLGAGRPAADRADSAPRAALAGVDSPAEGLRDEVIEYLKGTFAAVLKLDADEIETGVTFERYGVDSLVSMDILVRLEQRLPPLPKTLLFEHITLDRLADHLLEKHREILRSALGSQAGAGAGAGRARAGREASSSGSEAGGAVARGGAVAQGGAAPWSAVRRDDIAIIGVAGRYPMADDLDALWENLRDGRTAFTEIPRDRWDYREYEDASGEGPGTSYHRWGAFLSGVDRFDPLFFGISPREAQMMDPQERLFLETAWAALEDAGCTRARLNGYAEEGGGRGVGVFVGVMYGLYQVLAAEEWARRRLEVSSAYWSIANRVSYFFDFHGPSMAIDTACSSSLTAIHMACESIRRGECRAAIAGGVNVIIHPSHHAGLSRMKMLSRGPICRAFGEGADGFVSGEGVGAVLLKPLSDAIRDGDRIHGIIKSSFINANGKTGGYTVPSPSAQADLIEATLRRENIDPRTVSYVEAQAVGSALADPIEVVGLTKAFERFTADKGFCALGSVKPNIGHLESASGVAQLTKVLLQLRHKQLAPTLHGERLNPFIDFENSPFFVRGQLRPWAAPDILDPVTGRPAPRRAGISSFGAGGANAHLIVEEHVARDEIEAASAAEDRSPQIIVLSARKPEQLREQARRLRDFLTRTSARGRDGAPPASLADMAFTLQTGREAMAARLALIASDRAALERTLGLCVEGREDLPNVLTGVVKWSGKAERPAAEEVERAIASGRLEPVAEAWVRGAEVPWERLHEGHRRRRVSLPGYAFARERYWLDQAEPRSTAAPVAQAAAVDSAPPAPAPERAEVAVAAPRPSPRAEAAPVAVGGSGRGEAPAKGGAVSKATLLRSVQATVIKHIAAILSLRASDVDLDEPISDYGFDSISLTRLVTLLSEEYGITLRPPVFFEHPTIGSLTAFLVEKHGEVIARAIAAPPADAGEAPRAEPPAPSPALAVEPPRPPEGQAQVEAAVQARAEGDEPIAIIGMAGRFPGSPDLDSFWDNLIAGEDLITEIPEDRFDWRAIYGDPLQDPTKIRSKWGGFISDVDKFDASFFNISPREARSMDPQHRIFLQTVWKTIEDAGYRPSELAGTSTGILVGIGSTEYAQALGASGMEIDGQAATGNVHSMAANRISFLLDLHGPSEPIDTACSSSLVAIHRAIQAIRSGDCEMAIAGGVNLLLAPEAFLAFGKSGMLSSDGRCKTFDNSADGYVRGEGVGAIFLKPLRKALADGDHVYAVVRGSAVNHGGRANSLTAPNPNAQAEIVRQALERAGIRAETISYIEAHGTGTVLGDPVEINGLKMVFRELSQDHGAEGSRRKHCGLGTVKTNIGHLETAAGVAGLIKVVLAMKHRKLPPLMHFKRLNQYIELDDSPFYIVDRARDWEPLWDEQRATTVRRAGVSSFGFGGANVHVVLEAFDPPPALEEASARGEIVVLSARDEVRLKAYAEALLAHLERLEQERRRVRLPDLAWTLQVGRDAMSSRLAIVVQSHDELLQRLREIVAGQGNSDVLRGDGTKHKEILAPFEGDGDAQQYFAELMKGGHLRKLATFWVMGANVDWNALSPRGRRRVPLPSYPFAPERYWVSERKAPALRSDPPPPAPRPAPPALEVSVAAAPPPAGYNGVASLQVAQVVPVAPPPPAPPPVIAAAPPSAAAAAAQVAPVAAGPAQAGQGGDARQRMLEQFRAIFAEFTGVEASALLPEREFPSYGIDSLIGLRIMQRVQQLYGDEVPMITVFEQPTLNRFTDYILRNHGKGASDLGGSGAAAPAPAPAAAALAPAAAASPPTAPTPRSSIATPAASAALAPTVPGLPAPAVAAPSSPEPQRSPASSRAWWQLDEPAPTSAPLRARLVPFRPKGTKVPLFGLYGDSGEVSWLMGLIAHLSKDQPVYGLEAPNWPLGAATIEEMADSCLEPILSTRSTGPYRLMGYASGGAIAFEVARRLQERGHEVSQLVLLGTCEPASMEIEALAGHADNSAYVLTWVVNTLRQMWGAHEIFRYDALPQGDFDTQLKKAVTFIAMNMAAPMAGQKLMLWLKNSALHWRTAIKALGRYWPRPLAQPIEATLVEPRRREPSHGNPYRLPALPAAGAESGGIWHKVLGEGARTLRAPGDRFSMASKSMLANLNKHAVEGAAAKGSPSPRAHSGSSGADAGHEDEAPRPEARADLTKNDRGAQPLFIVPINKRGIYPSSYWIHTLLGDISYALPLSQQLGLDYSVYGIEQFDTQGGLHLHSDLEEMAAQYVKAVRQNQPEGPYLLGGYSFGGIVAYEMARQILRDGGQVSDLILIDSLMPRTEVFNSVDTSALEHDDFSVMALMITGNSLCTTLQADRFVNLSDISGHDRAWQRRRVAEIVHQHAKVKMPFQEVQRMVSENYELIMTNNDALMGYEPKPLSGPVNTVMFRAALGFIGPNNKNGMPEVPVRIKDMTNGFGAFIPNPITTFDVDADHYTICTDEAIIQVGAKTPLALSFAGARRPS